jgi:hypothetical protein
MTNIPNGVTFIIQASNGRLLSTTEPYGLRITGDGGTFMAWHGIDSAVGVTADIMTQFSISPGELWNSLQTSTNAFSPFPKPRCGNSTMYILQNRVFPSYSQLDPIVMAARLETDGLDAILVSAIPLGHTWLQTCLTFWGITGRTVIFVSLSRSNP